MMEMRWAIRDGERQLQYRYVIHRSSFNDDPIWSAWVVVPDVYM
jgi:hypothetical protein